MMWAKLPGLVTYVIFNYDIFGMMDTEDISELVLSVSLTIRKTN